MYTICTLRHIDKNIPFRFVTCLLNPSPQAFEAGCLLSRHVVYKNGLEFRSLGCTPDGFCAAVEFKAPGKRGTLKPHQREFLIEKIKRGAFAVCVDSVECLEFIWTQFDRLRRHDVESAKQLLFNNLPKQNQRGMDDAWDF